MKQTKTDKDLYLSRNGSVKISRSFQHKDMWNIEETKTRMAHSLHASEEVILQLYPMDKTKKRK